MQFEGMGVGFSNNLPGTGYFTPRTGIGIQNVIMLVLLMDQLNRKRDDCNFVSSKNAFRYKIMHLQQNCNLTKRKHLRCYVANTNKNSTCTMKECIPRHLYLPVGFYPHEQQQQGTHSYTANVPMNRLLSLSPRKLKSELAAAHHKKNIDVE